MLLTSARDSVKKHPDFSRTELAEPSFDVSRQSDELYCGIRDGKEKKKMKRRAPCMCCSQSHGFTSVLCSRAMNVNTDMQLRSDRVCIFDVVRDYIWKFSRVARSLIQ